jgi:hypothetical protein
MIVQEKLTLHFHDNFTVELVVNRNDYNKISDTTEEFVLDETHDSLSYCSPKNQFLSRILARVKILC